MDDPVDADFFEENDDKDNLSANEDFDDSTFDFDSIDDDDDAFEDDRFDDGDEIDKWCRFLYVSSNLQTFEAVASLFPMESLRFRLSFPSWLLISKESVIKTQNRIADSKAFFSFASVVVFVYEKPKHGEFLATFLVGCFRLNLDEKFRFYVCFYVILRQVRNS